MLYREIASQGVGEGQVEQHAMAMPPVLECCACLLTMSWSWLSCVWVWFITKVIMASSFSAGGVEQVNFDLQHYFLPMLADHCDDAVGRQLYEK